MTYTLNTRITEVINDPLFQPYGRLIFPVHAHYMSGQTLRDLQLTWYNYIDPDQTVEVLNYFKHQVDSGETIFYDIYTEEEKRKERDKRNTGLFYFKGQPNQPFAICNAGGGFAYVGAMHDSFPLALELSKKGYHGFALIYRPGAQTGCEDLSRAIQFIFAHAKDFGLSTKGYSLWGGSAGARLSSWLGSYGTKTFIGQSYPKPSTVVMQYTGLNEINGDESPTYACVGTNDWIADHHTVERYINTLKRRGVPAKVEVFRGLPHGFGLGTHTIAQGWVDRAVAFWQSQS